MPVRSLFSPSIVCATCTKVAVKSQGNTVAIGSQVPCRVLGPPKRRDPSPWSLATVR
jgi:hypothetical protein